MNKLLIAGSTLLIAASAHADDGDLARCRAITDANARLACYDAIPLAGAARVPSAPALPAAGSAPTAATVATRAPAPVEERNLPATAAAKPAAEQFGLENKRPKDELQEIVTRIDGTFDGWVPNQRIRLANGQVWQIADDTTRWFTFVNPKVTIWRGTFGVFYMNIEGHNQSPRVKRVQ
ncbi:MAG: hypothetical protein HY255_03515 [Betaproteobacteria bacterium]|nr:hypothetical protein [Betaproteobacteria bacterium]